MAPYTLAFKEQQQQHLDTRHMIRLPCPIQCGQWTVRRLPKRGALYTEVRTEVSVPEAWSLPIPLNMLKGLGKSIAWLYLTQSL